MQRTSIIGYIIAGLFVGIGSKMIEGDIFSHGYQNIPKRNLRSLIAVVLIFVFTCFASTLGNNNSIVVLYSDPYVIIDVLHVVSANICLILGIVFLITAFFVRKGEFGSNEESFK
jgi:hypothetical protein